MQFEQIVTILTNAACLLFVILSDFGELQYNEFIIILQF